MINDGEFYYVCMIFVIAMMLISIAYNVSIIRKIIEKEK